MSSPERADSPGHEGSGSAAISRRVNLALAAAFAFGIVPLAVLAVLVARYAVDLPFSDEWGMTRLFRKSRLGELVFDDFHRQHSVHRLLIPKYILYTIANWTGWNTRYESGVNVLAGIAICAVLSARVAFMARRFQSAAYAFVIPLLCLVGASLMQFENWLWGWQIQIFLVVLMVILSVFALTAPTLGVPRFALAAVCAVVATFSFANGLLLWPLGFALIAARIGNGARFPKTFMGVWAALGVLACCAYFYGFTMPPRTPDAPSNWASPMLLVEYFFAYLGAPFAAFSIGVAVGIGVGGLCVFIASLALHYKSKSLLRPEVLSGLALCFFGLGSAVMTTFGRSDFGTVQAMSSRYVTISNVFWVGLVFLVVAFTLRDATQRPPVPTWLRYGVVAVLIGIACATLRANVTGARGMEGFSRTQQILRYKLLAGHMDEQMKTLHFDLKWLRYHANITRRHELWAWRPGAPASMFEVPEFLATDAPGIRREVRESTP